MADVRRYSVRWTAGAETDLADILVGMAATSVSTAQKWLERLRTRAGSLESMPERGRVVPELSTLGVHRYRELIIKPYRLVYRIRADEVVVLLLFDGRRRAEDVLLDRLLRA